jgi:hypothetical protein
VLPKKVLKGKLLEGGRQLKGLASLLAWVFVAIVSRRKNKMDIIAKKFVHTSSFPK